MSDSAILAIRVQVADSWLDTEYRIAGDKFDACCECTAEVFATELDSNYELLVCRMRP